MSWTCDRCHQERANAAVVVVGDDVICTECASSIIADIPLERLEQICASEKEGRCVVLPSEEALEDAADAFKAKIHAYVKEVYQQGVKDGREEYEAFEDGFDCDVSDAINDIIGKTVFLSRADAEAAMQKGAANEADK